MVNQRLSPEQLLQKIKQEERKEGRGKLKIYLGAAPGVGKTHTMLLDAIAKRSKGLDVIVGVAESHGREEIDLLLTQLEQLPRQEVEYRDRAYKEFDLDGALQRHPGLILVDEMAHTNAPGLRHEKRWQDIKELLDRGIDVYTTLNVQHIESLKDDVAQIIQAPIKETVPDSMIEMADTIELIDLPPEELLKRLQEGKIYFPAQAELAKEHFFRKGNLIALRELALRATAERVGTDVLLYRQDVGIKHIWAIKDKILVCVGPRPETQTLIRSAKRMATSLQAEWIAVYVDRPRVRSSRHMRNAAIQNLRLAELLGADTYVLTGFDIVEEIMNFARKNNVTQIVVWKNVRKRWKTIFKPTLTDELVRHSGEIDVYIKTGHDTAPDLPTEHEPKKYYWGTYLWSFVAAGIATGLNSLLYEVVSPSNLIIIYLLAVTLTALFTRLGPSILTSILSVLSYDFFFVKPLYTFSLSNYKQTITMLLMLFVSQIIIYLTIIARRQAESMRATEQQTIALYTLTRKLTVVHEIRDLMVLGANYIAQVFNSDVMALLPKKHHLKVVANTNVKKDLNVKELSVAQWVHDMGQPAGFGTETLTFSKALYIPLLSASGAIGVFRIEPKDHQLFTPEQMKLLESCINQVTLALEVARLQEKERREHLQIETDRVRTNLLRAIFHDLCYPLKRVINAVNDLKKLEGANLRIIEKNIDHEIDKLTRLNNNLYLIIQMETEELVLNKALTSLKKIINSVLKICQDMLKDREVKTDIAEDIPMILIDSKLIQEVFYHLFDNAIKFSPPKTPIHVFVYTEHRKIVVSIEDFGAGVSSDEKHKIFEKFYRGKDIESKPGLGLGLAICQKIVKAHNGQIWVETLDHKGGVIRFTLPIISGHKND